MTLEAAVPDKPAQRFWRKHGLKLIVSLFIAAAFAFTLRRGGLPIIPPADALRRVDVGSCVLYMLLFIGWNTVRATRWRHLLAPIAHVPLRRIVAISWIGFAAILIFPLRAGEIVRPYMMRQKGKISMAAATGTVGAERIIDGLFITLLLGVALQLAHPLSPLPDHIGKLHIPVAAVPLSAYLSLAGFTSAFVLMGVFFFRPTFGRRIVEASLGVFSKPLAARVSEFVARSVDGLRFLPHKRYFGLFLAETTVYWLANGFSMWVLARGCGITSITIVQAFVVMGVLGVGILVPAGPGLFGAFQASTYAGLAMYFHDDVVLGPGGAFVFLLYALQCAWQLLTAGFFLLVDREAARLVIGAETA
jgi:uncharacterized protein (TIRG00374 family)